MALSALIFCKILVYKCVRKNPCTYQLPNLTQQVSVMILNHNTKNESDNTVVLEIFYVEESSNLIGWYFWATTQKQGFSKAYVFHRKQKKLLAFSYSREKSTHKLSSLLPL